MNRRNFLSTIIAAACAPALKPETDFEAEPLYMIRADMELAYYPANKASNPASAEMFVWWKCVQEYSAGDIHDAA